MSKFFVAQTNNLLPDTIVFCEGDTSSIEINSLQESNYSITWNTPYSIITNTRKIRPLASGKYFVKVNFPRFHAPLNDSAVVQILKKSNSKITDTTICQGESILISSNKKALNYFWNTRQTSKEIKVFYPGKYFVTSNFGSCSVTDTFKIKQPPSLDMAKPSETVFCIGDENKVLTVKANAGISLLWSTGSNASSISVNKEGTYFVTASSRCGMKLDSIKVKFKACDCEMIIPNSFTPNEDYKNDYFFPVLSCEYSYFNITIFDRWGYTVFMGNNSNAKWDGRFKGNFCPEDIYTYKIECTEKGSDKKLIHSGHVALFR